MYKNYVNAESNDTYILLLIIAYKVVSIFLLMQIFPTIASKDFLFFWNTYKSVKFSKLWHKRLWKKHMNCKLGLCWGWYYWLTYFVMYSLGVFYWVVCAPLMACGSAWEDMLNIYTGDTELQYMANLHLFLSICLEYFTFL